MLTVGVESHHGGHRSAPRPLLMAAFAELALAPLLRVWGLIERRAVGGGGRVLMNTAPLSWIQAARSLGLVKLPDVRSTCETAGELKRKVVIE